MAAYSIVIIVVIAIMIGLIALSRYGFKESRQARNVTPRPEATEALAITALFVAIFFPPLGIFLAYWALYRIGLGLSRGYEWARNALFVGYGILLIELLGFLILYPGLRWFG